MHGRRVAALVTSISLISATVLAQNDEPDARRTRLSPPNPDQGQPAPDRPTEVAESPSRGSATTPSPTVADPIRFNIDLSAGFLYQVGTPAGIAVVRNGGQVGVDVLVSPNRLYAFGLGYERAFFGAEQVDLPMGSLFSEQSRSWDALPFFGRVYPWQNNYIAIFAQLGVGPVWQHVSTSGVASLVSLPCPGSIVVQRPPGVAEGEPFVCNASDSAGFGAQGAIGFDAGVSSNITLHGRIGFNHFRGSNESLGNCADGMGAATFLTGSLGLTLGTAARPIPPNKQQSNKTMGSTCINGDAELGDFTGWTAYAGVNANGTANLSPSSFLTDRHVIMKANGPNPYDPVLGGKILPVAWPIGGNYSIRLGNKQNGAKAERLTYKMAVTPSNMLFHYSYAVVLEDPGHEPASQQPFFMVRAHTKTKVIYSFLVQADKSNPYFKYTNATRNDHNYTEIPLPTTVVYRPWSCETIDLSAYVGQEVFVEFTTADCAQGGHFGYAYIDGLCSDEQLRASFDLAESACASSDFIVADGTESANETDHFWSIEESDANWGQNPSTEVSIWFPAKEAGRINLVEFYKGKGKDFKCDTYYRVKLAVKNSCVPWSETVKLLYIRPCPAVDAGPDRAICALTGSAVQIGTAPAVGSGPLVYSWSPKDGLSSAVIAQPLASPSKTTEYKLNAVDKYGCSSSDSIEVRVEKAKPFVSITASITDSATCCNSARTLTAIPAPVEGTNLMWTTGSTEASITINPVASTTYSVTASNICGFASADMTLKPYVPPTGSFSQIVAPNAFTPNGDDKNDVFQIFAKGWPQGADNAYNACSWSFVVFNRWGEEIAHRSGQATVPFGGSAPFLGSGSLPAWDGRTDSGELVIQGTYVYILTLCNCSGCQVVKTSYVNVIF